MAKNWYWYAKASQKLNIINQPHNSEWCISNKCTVNISTYDCVFYIRQNDNTYYNKKQPQNIITWDFQLNTIRKTYLYDSDALYFFEKVAKLHLMKCIPGHCPSSFVCFITHYMTMFQKDNLSHTLRLALNY